MDGVKACPVVRSRFEVFLAKDINEILFLFVVVLTSDGPKIIIFIFLVEAGVVRSSSIDCFLVLKFAVSRDFF